MNKLVIMDIDGVLADFEGKLVNVLIGEFGEIATRNRDKFRLEDRYGEYPKVLGRALELVKDPNFYYGLDVYEGAADFVKKLVLNDYQIVYVSSRPVAAGSFTTGWLLKNFYGQAYAACGVADKADFVSNMKDEIEFVVEDNPEQIDNLKDGGLNVFCWSQAWNEGVFPRLYVRSDGELMLWMNEAEEAEPFWSLYKEKA